MTTFVRARREDADWYGTGITVGELICAAALARARGDERRHGLYVARARAEYCRQLQKARKQMSPLLGIGHGVTCGVNLDGSAWVEAHPASETGDRRVYIITYPPGRHEYGWQDGVIAARPDDDPLGDEQVLRSAHMATLDAWGHR